MLHLGEYQKQSSIHIHQQYKLLPRMLITLQQLRFKSSFLNFNANLFCRENKANPLDKQLSCAAKSIERCYYLPYHLLIASTYEFKHTLTASDAMEAVSKNDTIKLIKEESNTMQSHVPLNSTSFACHEIK